MQISRIEKTIQRRFSNREELDARINPTYPLHIEQDYERVARGCMRLYNNVLQAYMPAILGFYEVGDFENLEITYTAMQAEFERNIQDYGLNERVQNIGSRTGRNCARQFRNSMMRSLGFALAAQYYSSWFSRDILPYWTTNNIEILLTFPKQATSEIRGIVNKAYSHNSSLQELAKNIQQTHKTSQSNAERLARNQIQELNAEITERIQKDAGIEKFIWVTVGDSKVRRSHEALKGRKFTWEKGAEFAGQYGQTIWPGKGDWGCRCTAKPVYNLRAVWNMAKRAFSM